MTPLGKALRFYCRYAAEMNYLYDSEIPDVSGLEDGEKVLEMARAVGQQASSEAGKLARECGRRIREHFESVGPFRIEKEPRSDKVVREWRWYCYLRSDIDPEIDVECGVYIAPAEKVIVPWFWRNKGGKHWESRAIGQLGSKAHSGSGGGWVQSSGTIALPPVHISIDDDSVDGEALILDVVSRFQAVTAEDVRVIGRIDDE